MTDARAGGNAIVDEPARDRAYWDAVRARDKVLARMTFWERHRAALLLPLMLVGAGLGLLLGMAVRAAFDLPAQTNAFGAVLGIVVLGRVVTYYFHVQRLEAAQRRVDVLARLRRPPT